LVFVIANNYSESESNVVCVEKSTSRITQAENEKVLSETIAEKEYFEI